MAPKRKLQPPPTGLDDVAREEWYRVVAELEAAEQEITDRDRGVLSAYCQTWSRWLDAETQISEQGALIVLEDGRLQENPYVKIARSAAVQLRMLSVELGLTPRSRAARKPKQEDEQPASPLANLHLRN